MFIDCKTFEEWLHASDIDAVSPGTVAREWQVSRQTVHNWINKDVIDAYRYKGPEGSYLIVNRSEYPKIAKYRKEVYKYIPKKW